MAVVLLLQALASASGFMPPPKNSPSIKTSDLSKSGLGGFDLIAKTNKKFIEGSTSPSPPPKAGVVVAKKVPIKKVVATSPPPKKALAAAPQKKVAVVSQKKVAVVSQKKVAIVAKGGTKAKVTTLGMDGGKVAPTETPWSTILVSFLIPWRNPNSIFLYMFLIITVLGKMKEHNQ